MDYSSDFIKEMQKNLEETCINVEYTSGGIVFKDYTNKTYDFSPPTPEQIEELINKFINKKEMRKEDLKDGMIVETKDGELRIVLKGHLLSFNNGGGLSLKWYSNELRLKDTFGDGFKIIRVYEIKDGRNLQGGLAYWIDDKGILHHCNLLWERKETPEYTMEEAIEKMGYEFKIKK